MTLNDVTHYHIRYSFTGARCIEVSNDIPKLSAAKRRLRSEELSDMMYRSCINWQGQ